MTRSIACERFLILSKNEINKMFMEEKECSYKITQIEPGFNDDYMVEVVGKGSGVPMEPTLDNIAKLLAVI